MIRGKINKKKFQAYLISCVIIGFLFILITILFLNFINSLIDISNFINTYGMAVAYIIGGYSMNLFAFTFLNKKWNDLTT